MTTRSNNAARQITTNVEVIKDEEQQMEGVQEARPVAPKDEDAMAQMQDQKLQIKGDASGNPFVS